MTSASEPSTLETSDIQGIIISGYGHLRFSSYHFLRFTDRARAREWLGSIVEQTTTADWGTDGNVKRPDWTLNVAFTAGGLADLGLSSLETFPQEFREGMSEQHRARRLGDQGGSAPEKWDLGGPGSTIHALLILQAASDGELKGIVDKQTGDYRNHQIDEAAVIYGTIELYEREHFGFHDSISQPVIEGAPGHAGLDGDAIQAGEFILGYRNEYGVLPPTPTIPAGIDPKQRLRPVGDNAAQRDLGRNGSFLVVRKLLQDVAAFNRFLAENDGGDAQQRAWLSAKLVGRWRNGAPLVLSPNNDNQKLATSNDFGYMASDPDSFACPLGAHIRRANPRDSLP